MKITTPNKRSAPTTAPRTAAALRFMLVPFLHHPVVLKEPDLSAVGPDAPVALQSLLRRCLVKDPRGSAVRIPEALNHSVAEWRLIDRSEGYPFCCR